MQKCRNLDGHYTTGVNKTWKTQIKGALYQGTSNLSQEIYFPAEFSSNPNQAHRSMLINVFWIIRKSQIGEFDQGWS